MIVLSYLALVIVVALAFLLAAEIALTLWRDGEAVEIDLRDLEESSLWAACREMKAGDGSGDE